MSLSNPSPPWQPTASRQTLIARAKLLNQIRQFFLEREVVEVTTPLISQHTVTDRHIHSISLNHSDPRYLQTSPEYAMKRLVAAGYGAIFQIGPAVRAEEAGRLHNPEFTLLEWYRPDFDHHLLMQEVDTLLQDLLQTPPADKITYQQLFLDYLSIDIDRSNKQQLIKAITCQTALAYDWQSLDFTTLLQVALTELIEPSLGQQAPLFVHDCPAEQAALARINPHTQLAERFELYVQGIELANGFHELCDANALRQRFVAEQQLRKQQSLAVPAIDERFMAALEAGMPACAGVALGFDRLVMLAIGARHIDQVLTFPWHRA